jgi:hypothetical protein
MTVVVKASPEGFDQTTYLHRSKGRKQEQGQEHQAAADQPEQGDGSQPFSAFHPALPELVQCLGV